MSFQMVTLTFSNHSKALKLRKFRCGFHKLVDVVSGVCSQCVVWLYYSVASIATYVRITLRPTCTATV